MSTHFAISETTAPTVSEIAWRLPAATALTRERGITGISLEALSWRDSPAPSVFVERPEPSNSRDRKKITDNLWISRSLVVLRLSRRTDWECGEEFGTGGR
jgi:hypothetical protein